jgi:O-antigen ligase
MSSTRATANSLAATEPPLFNARRRRVPGGPPAARRPGGTVRRQHVVSAVVRWAFYLFAFSIPLEYPQRTIPLEVHTITGSLFLLAALLQPRICFRRPPAAFFWLAAYLWVYAALTVLSHHPAEAWKLFFNYLLVAFVLWAGSNILRFDSVARKAFVGFIIGAAIIGILQRLEIGTTDVEGRLVVFGQDANLLGGNMAIGLVMLLGLAFGRDRVVPPRYQVIAGLAGLLLLRTLLYSASRGAGLAVVGGLVVFAFRGGNARQIAKHVAVAVLAGAVLMAAAYRNQSLLKRYQSTMSEGDLSGREEIYPEAMKMFRERPVFGWGPIDHQYELGLRTSGYQIGARNADGVAVHLSRDTHDVPLDIVTSVGAVGAIPFFAAIACGVWAAWRVRAGPRATLPLALVGCVLAIGLSIDFAASKQLWLIVAYAIASAHPPTARRFVVRHRRRRAVPVVTSSVVRSP